MRTFTLANGSALPEIGYGTWKSTDGCGDKNLCMAFEAGYRLIDTAAAYGNEELVGQAMRACGLSREEVFLTSKVMKGQYGYQAAIDSFRDSCKRLGTDYLDLLLMHFPQSALSCPNWKEQNADTWKAMEELYREGKVRAIGVSNFLPHHIEALMEQAEIKPMVNQLELHVGYMQETAAAYMKEQGIQLQAYSPLGRTRVMSNPVVVSMAQKYQMSTAQFLLRFLLQQDICVIPKASTMERMKENLETPQTLISREDLYILLCLPQFGFGGEHPDLPRFLPQEEYRRFFSM